MGKFSDTSGLVLPAATVGIVAVQYGEKRQALETPTTLLFGCLHQISSDRAVTVPSKADSERQLSLLKHSFRTVGLVFEVQWRKLIEKVDLVIWLICFRVQTNYVKTLS